MFRPFFGVAHVALWKMNAVRAASYGKLRVFSDKQFSPPRKTYLAELRRHHSFIRVAKMPIDKHAFFWKPLRHADNIWHALWVC